MYLLVMDSWLSAPQYLLLEACAQMWLLPGRRHIRWCQEDVFAAPEQAGDTGCTLTTGKLFSQL